MEKFKVLIMGSDANSYYMARCTYEKYHIKAHLIGQKRLAFTKYSNILTISYVDDLWNYETFIKEVNNYAKLYKDYKILLVSTNETYSGFIAKYKDLLEDNLYYFNQNINILDTLTNKEKFYKTYKNSGLSFPKTIYYNVLKDNIIPEFTYPVVVKPSNVVKYNHISFNDKHKIYKLDSKEELIEVLSQIKDGGYDDTLIIQEFIPGDDTYLFDSVVYVSRKGEVKLISFAEIGLQERSKTMVGNAAVLINNYNLYDGDIDKMKKTIHKFMTDLKMNGFYEFDMKYDSRSKEFKVLEINARQGRCSYYISALGANLIEIMVNDLILKKDIDYYDMEKVCLLSFVPKSIVKKYINNKKYVKKVLKLWKKRVSPMECKLDKNFLRFLMMKKRLWHYNIEYKNSYWK